MIKKIDHISFAVKDMAETGKRLKEVYGAKFIMNVESEKGQYTCDMYSIGEDMIIGLLESTTPDGFVAKHIIKYGEGLQHIGVDVDSLDEAIEIFRENSIKYSNYSEIDNIRKEVLVSKANGFGAILQVMEWMGDYKKINSVERMKTAWHNE